MLSARHLHLLVTFVHVCREGSFTEAARNLSLSKSMVSEHLRSLEEALGARLLERTTRRVALTQTGEEVLAAAGRMLVAADEVTNIAESRHSVPSGVLRVAAPVFLGTTLVAPALARLCGTYPELRAELLSSDERTDPIEQRLDAMLSVNVPQDTALTSVQLGNDLEILAAAPELAASWRNATQPKDLAAAPWVAHSAIPSGAQYQFRNQRGTAQRLTPPIPRAVANTSDAIRVLVASGTGFAVLPMRLVHADIRAGRIVRVLPEWKGRTVRIHVCLPSQKHPAARVTRFLEALRAVFSEFELETRHPDEPGRALEPAPVRRSPRRSHP
ncbi:MAG TPA: LysR family transcriptional regulator [Polyangiaceae bacterium]|nr:LysR family transcriptional regulator [Polyangiaceae bacterium]